MALPKRVGVLLDDLNPADFGAKTFADGEQCEGVSFHSPNPMMLRQVKLAKRKALLCSTCAESLAVLDALHKLHEGSLPWEVRREFGNAIRALHKEMIGG